MTRIVGGRLSGRLLVTPRGAETRPTSEKVRAAIGNALEAAGAVSGARVLDLYAGSGALGFELLSRGAACAVFVDVSRAAQQSIRANIAALGGVEATVHPGSVSSFAARVVVGPFDLVVADPPYAEPDAAVAEALLGLHAAGALAAGADIVLERSVRSGDFDWPGPLVADRVKRYGDTVICYGHAP